MADARSWESDNLVFELALRRLRTRPFLGQLRTHPRFFAPAFMLASGHVIAILGVWVSSSGGSSTAIVLTILATMLSFGFGRLLQHIRTDGSRTGFLLMARELRFSEALFRDLLGVPLGATEYVEAMLAWRRREFLWDAWLWSLAVVILFPTLSGFASGALPLLIYVAAFFAGLSFARCEETRVSTLSGVCRTLKTLRCKLTGMPPEALTGDPSSEHTLFYGFGCAAAVVSVILSIILMSLLEAVLSGLNAARHSTAFGLLVGAFIFGLLQGWVMLSFRRGDEQENRKAAWLHMDPILEVVREEAHQQEIVGINR